VLRGHARRERLAQRWRFRCTARRPLARGFSSDPAALDALAGHLSSGDSRVAKLAAPVHHPLCGSGRDVVALRAALPARHSKLLIAMRRTPALMNFGVRRVANGALGVEIHDRTSAVAFEPTVAWPCLYIQLVTHPFGLSVIVVT
jgi:hypothetical protein